MPVSGEGGNAASGARIDARAVTNQLPASLTIGEAEAWRAGWVAAMARVVSMMRDRSSAYDRRSVDADGQEERIARRECALACDYAANAIASMEPPA